MSISTKQDLDVLIVGGGPAGTMLALELAAHGITFRIVDKAPQRSDKSRALIIQPRSFEVMNRHGNARKLYEKGSMTSGPVAWMNNKPVIHFNIDGVANHGDSEFGFPCLLSQVDTEAYLDECLQERYGREVKQGIEATSVIQDADGVNVTLRDVAEGTEETIRAKYVVGADGAHSVVCKSSKHIKFAGDTYPQEFLMCDTTIEDFKLPRDRYHLILETGLLAIFPMPGGWIRIMASRNKLSNAAPTLDEVKALIRNTLPGGGEITNATWITNFRLHHRVVNSYRDCRLLLIGDAAHIHSPVGGQGLNTGIQDAVNLGWKLARVIRGNRPDSFLDTFDEERRPIGEDLVAKTDRAFKLVSMTNPVAIYLRNCIVPWLAPYIASRGNLEMFYSYISQFGINYRQSSIVYKNTGFSGPVMAGDRAPDGEVDIDGETRRLCMILAPELYNFVLFSGSLQNGSELEDMERTAAQFEVRNTDKARIHLIVQEREIKHIPYSHRLHRIYGFSSPGFVYIRPDGYVAAIGQLEQIDEFLAWLN
ncbi:FAD binding domain-containing protein [Xylariaceae sp. AK1471]|nr:FAD binding domain-containing protein [Xylariaceae sp. AK1471]